MHCKSEVETSKILGRHTKQAARLNLAGSRRSFVRVFRRERHDEHLASKLVLFAAPLVLYLRRVPEAVATPLEGCEDGHKAESKEHHVDDGGLYGTRPFQLVQAIRKDAKKQENAAKLLNTTVACVVLRTVHAHPETARVKERTTKRKIPRPPPLSAVVIRFHAPAKELPAQQCANTSAAGVMVLIVCLGLPVASTGSNLQFIESVAEPTCADHIPLTTAVMRIKECHCEQQYDDTLCTCKPPCSRYHVNRCVPVGCNLCLESSLDLGDHNGYHDQHCK